MQMHRQPAVQEPRQACVQLAFSHARLIEFGSMATKRSKKKSSEPVDIEIFAGAGGMAIGLQQAGFSFSHVFELDDHTCRTLKDNHTSNGGILSGEVHQQDVTTVNWLDFSGPVRLLAGGAPCQPFSLAGRHLADKDDRNMFPEVLRAVRALQPQAIILENVQGLARPSFRPYFDYILRQLRYPSVAPKRSEEWQQHNQRILRHQASLGDKTEYQVNWALLEAADFGVPQNRRRVFIVATRADQFEKFVFPDPSHSKERLIEVQDSGDYWIRYGLKHHEEKVNGHKALQLIEGKKLKPWITVREAILDLPEPAKDEISSENNHWIIPGAKVYRGHSGSRLDWPSKTIKAGVHGVPGGENIVLMDDGSHRYFTLRETARLQGFPDNFVFSGARLHVTRQIGNAVPVTLAEAVGKHLIQQIAGRAKAGQPKDPSSRGNRRRKA